MTDEELEYLRQIKAWSVTTRRNSEPSLPLLRRLATLVGSKESPAIILDHIDWLVAFIELHTGHGSIEGKKR